MQSIVFGKTELPNRIQGVYIYIYIYIYIYKLKSQKQDVLELILNKKTHFQFSQIFSSVDYVKQPKYL